MSNSGTIIPGEAVRPHDLWGGWHNSPPAAVSLATLGMLGGLCGEPVSIWLRDYPLDVLGPLQRHLRTNVPEGQICEVIRPSDLRRLDRGLGGFAMIFIYPIPGRASTALAAQWMLEGRRETRLPMALFSGDQGLQDAPGAIVSVRGNPAESTKLRSLLAYEPAPDPLVRGLLDFPDKSRVGVTFAGLAPLFDSGENLLWRPRSLRAVQALRGLLAGHNLLRRVAAGPPDLGQVSPDLTDYAGVYEILRGSKAGLPDEPGDPVLAAMVRRANVYLHGLEEAGHCRRPDAWGREGDRSIATPRVAGREAPRRRPIGLRELADLGNSRSSLTRSLVASVLVRRDVQAIQELGLRKRLPAFTDPGSIRSDEALELLVTWSMKQVRKRFDRLRRQGFVDAERVPAGNGPWVIHMPEELIPLPGEFQGLPTVERVSEACRTTG